MRKALSVAASIVLAVLIFIAIITVIVAISFFDWLKIACFLLGTIIFITLLARGIYVCLFE